MRGGLVSVTLISSIFPFPNKEQDIGFEDEDAHAIVNICVPHCYMYSQRAYNKNYRSSIEQNLKCLYGL